MNFAQERLELFGLVINSGKPGADIASIPAGELNELIDRHRVVVLRGFAALDGAAFPGYCENFGEILEWDFGAVNELRASVNARNYLYTNREVPFHWDGAFAGKVPRLIFFHCDAAPRPGAGGETLFTDAVRTIGLANAQTKDKWRHIEITYTTKKIVHYGGSFTSPMIVDGVLRFAEPVGDLNPVSLDLDGIDLNERDPFLLDMYRRLRDKRVCYRHTWQDGDILIADNRTLLHGRNAFAKDAARMIRRVNIC